MKRKVLSICVCTIICILSNACSFGYKESDGIKTTESISETEELETSKTTEEAADITQPKYGLSTLFQTNFFRLFFRYCTGV